MKTRYLLILISIGAAMVIALTNEPPKAESTNHAPSIHSEAIQALRTIQPGEKLGFAAPNRFVAKAAAKDVGVKITTRKLDG